MQVSDKRTPSSSFADVIAICTRKSLPLVSLVRDRSVDKKPWIRTVIIGTGIAWNLLGFRDLLFPYKMLVIGVHETGHLLMCIFLGFRIGSFDIDPVKGGRTTVYASDG